MAIASRKLGFDEVEHRDLNFGMSPETVPRHWFGNDPWTTHWMNAILAAVPDGERWVMQCVRRSLTLLKDETVRKAGIAFIKQEHYHAREHDDMNQALIQQGVPAERIRQEGRGEREPLANNQTDAGRAQNRRVDIVIKPVIEGQEQQAWAPPPYLGA